MLFVVVVLKLVPVITTEVPIGPDAGEKLTIVGACAKMVWKPQQIKMPSTKLPTNLIGLKVKKVFICFVLMF